MISQQSVSDDAWDQVSAAFEQQEVVQLLMAIAAINVWNRLAISTRQALPS